MVLNIFCRIHKKKQYFHSGIEIGKVMTFVFTFSQLPRHPKNWFCTVSNNPAGTQLKNDKIIGLRLVIALIKV